MHPTPDVLPFLLVHGAVVWKLALVALIAGALLVVAMVRRLRARRAIRAVVAGLDGRGVIRGTLAGGQPGVLATTLTAHGTDNDDAVVSWRAGELWLDTDQGRVSIEGPVEVVAGSRTAAARNGVPASTRDELLASPPVTWLHRRRPFWRATTVYARVASLVAGDEVVATGKLEPAPGADPTDYRGSDVVLTLRSADDRAIQIAARAPRAAILRLALPVLALLGSLFAITGYKLEQHYGETWERSCRNNDDAERGPIALSNGHACALAAAMPGSRDDALEALLYRMTRNGYRDEQTVRRLLALSSMVGGCASVAQRLLDDRRDEDAAREAHACGERRLEHIALLNLGRFEEAAAVAVPGEGYQAALPVGATLIAAGQWSAAADAAIARARTTAAAPHERDAQQSTDLTVMHYTCLAELLRHHGGDRQAIARLRELYARPEGAVCGVMLAEVAPADERAALLQEHGDRPALLHTSVLAGRIGWAAGLPLEGYHHESPEQVLIAPTEMGSMSSLAKVWLIGLERDRLAAEAAHVDTLVDWFSGNPDVAQRVSRLRWLAVAQVFDGDLAGAMASAREAVARPDPSDIDRYDRRDLPHLPAIVALYTPATETPVDFGPPPGVDHDTAVLMRESWQNHLGRLLLRAGLPIDQAYFGPDDKYTAGLAAARTGDGAPLAAYMSSNPNLRWWVDGDVMAVLPRIVQGREEVVRQLIWSSPREDAALDYHFPFGLAARAFVRREVLRLAGATAEAARWDATYRRFDATFRDRRKLSALMMWDL